MAILAQIYDFRWALALVGLAAIVVSKIHTYYRLSHIKGPSGTGFTNLWHSRALLSCKSHIKYKEACDKYGMVGSDRP